MKRKKEEERDIATQALTIMKELAEGICETRCVGSLSNEVKSSQVHDWHQHDERLFLVLFDTVIYLILSGLFLNRFRLIRALDMTEESAKDGLETWVETALSELAVENEINDECDELALAMEVCLSAVIYAFCVESSTACM